MKEIKLSQNKHTLVDNEDFEYLNQWKWYAFKNKAGNWYARRKLKGKVVHMHREILKTPKGKYTDHVNGVSLDNRRCNLRIVTDFQNKWNTKIKRVNNTSGYKGVHWLKRNKKWEAHITYNNKKHHLGLFKDKHQAALIYNVAARHLFGEYSRLNEVKYG